MRLVNDTRGIPKDGFSSKSGLGLVKQVHDVSEKCVFAAVFCV